MAIYLSDSFHSLVEETNRFAETMRAVLILSILIPIAIPIYLKSKADSLRNQFVGMSVLRGKKLNEITSVVGSPNSFISSGEYSLYTWTAGRYRITLKFDASNTCLGVVSEAA